MTRRLRPFAIVALAAALGCEKEAAPSAASSGAPAPQSAPTAPDEDEDDETGRSRGKQFSMFAVDFRVGDTKSLGGKDAKLVKIEGAGGATKATFEIDGKPHTIATDECFEAGKHDCDVHRDGITRWCADRLWPTGGVVAPEGHH